MVTWGRQFEPPSAVRGVRSLSGLVSCGGQGCLSLAANEWPMMHGDCARMILPNQPPTSAALCIESHLHAGFS